MLSIKIVLTSWLHRLKVWWRGGPRRACLCPQCRAPLPYEKVAIGAGLVHVDPPDGPLVDLAAQPRAAWNALTRKARTAPASAQHVKGYPAGGAVRIYEAFREPAQEAATGNNETASKPNAFLLPQADTEGRQALTCATCGWQGWLEVARDRFSAVVVEGTAPDPYKTWRRDAVLDPRLAGLHSYHEPEAPA